jgi:lysozyme family protein
MGHEGGWVDDPDDRGGETYRGIARKHHPGWDGWPIVDEIKRTIPRGKKKKLNRALKENRSLQREVKRFYEIQFWNRFRGDEISDQGLAEELFDTGVNMGVHQAVRFLQAALNLLNRNGSDYDDIVEDGGLGPTTLGTVRAYLKKDGSSAALLRVMNVLQGMHYIELARLRPSQERFMRGWLSRTV